MVLDSRTSLVRRLNSAYRQSPCREFSSVSVQIVDSEVEECGPGALRIEKHRHPIRVRNPPLGQSVHRIIICWASEQTLVPRTCRTHVGHGDDSKYMIDGHSLAFLVIGLGAMAA